MKKFNWKKFFKRIGVKTSRRDYYPPDVVEQLSQKYGRHYNWTFEYRKFKKNPYQWIMWAFMGNDEDGMAPFSHVGGQYWGDRVFRWWFRNPVHNMTDYVLGCDSIHPTLVDAYNFVPTPNDENFQEWITGVKYPTSCKGYHLLWMRMKENSNYKHPLTIWPKGFRLPFFSSTHFSFGWKRDGHLGTRFRYEDESKIPSSYEPIKWYDKLWMIPFLTFMFLIFTLVHVIGMTMWLIFFILYPFIMIDQLF